MPVIQGWTHGDYLDCIERYERAGVDLRSEPIVGVGTMCRRGETLRAGWILRDLAAEGLRLHGFGFKTEGLRLHGEALASADSLSWSLNASNRAPIPGHDRPGPGRRTGHRTCSNCKEYALQWREDLLGRIGLDLLALPVAEGP